MERRATIVCSSWEWDRPDLVVDVVFQQSLDVDIQVIYVRGRIMGWIRQLPRRPSTLHRFEYQRRIPTDPYPRPTDDRWERCGAASDGAAKCIGFDSGVQVARKYVETREPEIDDATLQARLLERERTASFDD